MLLYDCTNLACRHSWVCTAVILGDTTSPELCGCHDKATHAGGIGETGLPRHVDPGLIVGMIDNKMELQLKNKYQVGWPLTSPVPMRMLGAGCDKHVRDREQRPQCGLP